MRGDYESSPNGLALCSRSAVRALDGQSGPQKPQHACAPWTLDCNSSFGDTLRHNQNARGADPRGLATTCYFRHEIRTTDAIC